MVLSIQGRLLVLREVVAHDQGNSQALLFLFPRVLKCNKYPIALQYTRNWFYTLFISFNVLNHRQQAAEEFLSCT